MSERKLKQTAGPKISLNISKAPRMETRKSAKGGTNIIDDDKNANVDSGGHNSKCLSCPYRCYLETNTIAKFKQGKRDITSENEYEQASQSI
ncbi:hypothetical protein PAAG_12062 [Paracoccidioides lutzii Pb01]|uniref:Uncharacterized protein n=1 Tax=Paracoccidioides lutzii (strain ATCC MYA-826 / Pb01) TaxID=502779 RepID=A0A0A2VK07_PARBA|nr:hypothetical protein PAAG_12062 [Paracoccidioides lutzii Pb01]KGQ01204.1 hypothetical protein PAAG_12062 [Paracoccidioides lutzii Pb01]